MRIHGDKITRQNIMDAARTAGVCVLEASEHGSRSRKRAFNVALSGSGRHATQYGDRDTPSATWDEWGIFLEFLYRHDPEQLTRAYESHEFFRWSTGNRFDTLQPSGQHVQHRFTYQGRSLTGLYHISECRCGAVRRHMAYGHNFAEIAA